jgi:hypothetical protein
MRRYAKLGQYPINLMSLPDLTAERAMFALDQLYLGVPYQVLRGKRIQGQRTVISIRVDHSYRLICRDGADGVKPVEVVSHEVYDSGLAQRRWCK